MSEENSEKLSIVDAVINVNESQKKRVIQKMKDSLGVLKGKTIAVLGLSFKPNTDDIRDAPALYIVQHLMKEGARIRAYDPIALKEVKRVFPKIALCKDSYDAAKGADALVIVTEWNQFRNLDLDRLKKLMKTPCFFDLRNVYEPDKLRAKGFTYYCVGRV